MADVTNTNQTETNTENQTNTTTENQATEKPEIGSPTVEELMAQLASERAEKEKYKNASDKASSEAAKYKKELRSKQTAEEQEAEAKAEADRRRDEELESLRKELNHNKATAAYKSIQNEKVVESLIEAVSDADHATIASIIEAEKKAAVKAAQAEWLKSRPPVNAGTGNEASVTKEQFDRMNYAKRVELKRKDPELYKKYTSN